MNILIAGGGALGSQIAHHLAQKGIHLIIVDDDHIEESNITVSVYSSEHVAKQKAHALAGIAISRGSTAEARDITATTPEDFAGADMVIDCFDNVAARKLTTELDVPTLHVGVGLHGNGMIFWDEVYELPETSWERGENPICTNALGAPLLRRTALRASEVIEHWLWHDKKVNTIVSAELEEA